ncbi:MAG: hypothetical protein CMJ58_03750 [Planctomycetaceae bacterium]|nr:hypothetical protein [Planctomycetaceae bacterium]
MELWEIRRYIPPLGQLSDGTIALASIAIILIPLVQAGFAWRINRSGQKLNPAEDRNLGLAMITILAASVVAAIPGIQ